MTTETAALERHHANGAGVDLATAGRGIAAAADASIAVAWVQKYAVVYDVVDQIVDTPLFPSSFWPMPVGVKPWEFRTPWLKHPDESHEDYVQRRRIAAAGGTTTALWGEGYGWSPPQSWRLIYVANGKASLYAEGVNALLRAAGFGVENLERSDTVARVAIRRPGGPPVEYEFTFDDAVRAGYVPKQGPNEGNDQYGKPKKGGNEKYLTDPKTMLWARALTIGARIEAPDVIAGMPVAELAGDEVDDRAVVSGVTVEDAQAPAAKKSGGADALRAAIGQGGAARDVEQPAPLASTTGDVPAGGGGEQPPTETGESVTDKTWAAINAQFVTLGVTGPGQGAKRWFVVQNILRRADATSRDHITEAQGVAVLRMLQGTTRVGITQLLERMHTPSAAEPAPEPVESGPPLPGDGDDQDLEPQPGDGEGPAPVRGDDPWDEPDRDGAA